MTQDGGLLHTTSVPSRGGVEQKPPGSSEVQVPQHVSPPFGAPPLPTLTSSETGGPSAGREQMQAFAGGAKVRVLNVALIGAVAGQVGNVVASDATTVTIQLDSGLVLQQVRSAVLMLDVSGEATGATQAGTDLGQSFSAPFTTRGPPTKVQAQASRIKDALVKAHSLASSVPTSGSTFWQAVKNDKDLYGLEPTLVPLLQSPGYIGDATLGPPREDELRMGGPSHGTGGSLARVME